MDPTLCYTHDKHINLFLLYTIYNIHVYHESILKQTFAKMGGLSVGRVFHREGFSHSLQKWEGFPPGGLFPGRAFDRLTGPPNYWPSTYIHCATNSLYKGSIG